MSEKDKLIHAAKLMGITACRHREGGGLRESIERDVLEFYEGAGITFPDGFVALLESHVKWLNEEVPDDVLCTTDVRIHNYVTGESRIE